MSLGVSVTSDTYAVLWSDLLKGRCLGLRSGVLERACSSQAKYRSLRRSLWHFCAATRLAALDVAWYASYTTVWSRASLALVAVVDCCASLKERRSRALWRSVLV